MSRIGIIGGTFDPVHLGHLAAARAAQDALGLDEVWFIPSGQPPHRPDRPRASGYHRLRMTELAVAAVDGWRVSDIELSRAGASYTFDTLTALRQAQPAAQFFFITGADAFAEIASWRRYPDVLDLAHFVVITRSGTTFARLRGRLPAMVSRMVDLGAPPWRPAPPADTPRIYLVTAPTPDISSTEIRTRAAAGGSLDTLVPPPVVQYLKDHPLYV